MIRVDGILKPQIQVDLHLVHEVGYTRPVEAGPCSQGIVDCCCKSGQLDLVHPSRICNL